MHPNKVGRIAEEAIKLYQGHLDAGMPEDMALAEASMALQLSAGALAQRGRDRADYLAERLGQRLVTFEELDATWTVAEDGDVSPDLVAEAMERR